MIKKWTASEMGKIGGKNRAKNLTKKERSNIARLGGLKRWKNKNTETQNSKEELST